MNFFRIILSFVLFSAPISSVSAQAFLKSGLLEAEKIATNAGYSPTSDEQAQADLIDTIINLVRIALGFVGMVVTLIVLWAGWQYMTAGGSQEKIGTALKWLTNGIIGLLIIMAAYGISSFVLRAILEQVIK